MATIQIWDSMESLPEDFKNLMETHYTWMLFIPKSCQSSPYSSDVQNKLHTAIEILDSPEGRIAMGT